MRKILIIGAQNIDLFAHAKADYVLQDSNPAKMHMAFGGVACNIASNLALLGKKVDFITVFGGDYFSRLAIQNLQDLGIAFQESLHIAEANNSVYLGLMDNANELFLGINDMDIVEALDVNFFKKKQDYIAGFDVLVIDNNLSLEALAYLLPTYAHKEIIMDAVSAKKALKLSGLLANIKLLKLNVMELDALSDKASIKEKLDDLITQGLKAIILTNSAEEIVYQSSDSRIISKPRPIEKIANVTGAGDAFLAGFVSAVVEGCSIEECLEAAKETAYHCLLSPNAIIQKKEEY